MRMLNKMFNIGSPGTFNILFNRSFSRVRIFSRSVRKDHFRNGRIRRTFFNRGSISSYRMFCPVCKKEFPLCQLSICPECGNVLVEQKEDVDPDKNGTRPDSVRTIT